ncbi:GumC family protein [Tropicibacter alexandrii]|uniref:GumC family protein n=1 Tax=Tropicibacter alexandrii TaxID=2267683 RepID=UPI000EF534CF|nr:Wzz/FepE/Etk N-terminal domain-containing protein [Tropicibacter alexandrii]
MNQFQSFDEILSAIKRRFWVIVIITFIGCLFSLNYALGQVKVYEATAVVQIEDASVPDQLAGASAGNSASATRGVKLIEQRLMSRDNLFKVVEKHDLFADDPTVTPLERVGLMREAARIEEIRDQTQQFAPGGNAPSGLLISVRLTDPDKAAEVANELMTFVIDQSRDRNVGRARETLDLFSSEEARVAEQIAALENRIAAYKSENALQLPEGVRDLRGQLASLRETELDLDQQILTLETTANRQREEVLERQIGLLEEQKLLIVERATQIEALIASAPQVERELSAMEREMSTLQEQYSVITRRKAEAEMGQFLEDRQAAGGFEVLETALVPEYPISRSRKKTAIMGGVASVIAGLAAAFIIELLNPALRSAGQVERALGVQPVVSIPVVATGRDRRRRGLSVFGKIAMAVLALLAGLRIAAEYLPWLGELFGKASPRAARV